VPAAASFHELISGYRLVFADDFGGDRLDESVWLPYYLPHWAGRAASLASHRVCDGRLRLFIDDQQIAWRADVESQMRVSSIQTGCFAGPLGSTVGQHRTHDLLRVVEEQPFVELLTPLYGAIEMRARWQPVPGQMVAWWMIGVEDRPERSAEICVFEIFGNEATADGALVGCGVHPFGDPTIVDDFEKVQVGIDVSEWHDYAVVWTPTAVTFFVDGRPTKHVEQALTYPMQLMVNIYDFGPFTPRRDGPFEIDRVRLHQRADGAEVN
jgi:hypothetical protein